MPTCKNSAVVVTHHLQLTAMLVETLEAPHSSGKCHHRSIR